MKIYKFYLVLSIFTMLAASACKKDKKDTGEPTENATREELTKDSIFLYAKETYLWNDLLPEYAKFNPRSFADFDKEVDAFKNYQPLDKYSFIDEGAVATELGGVSTGDYGFSIFYNNLVDPNDLRVKYVYAGSPAGLAGLRRGDRITKINNNSNLSAESNANIDFVVNAIYGSSKTVALSIKKANGATQDVTLNKGVYNINPILLDSIYTSGIKKVGYLVFNSFTGNVVPALENVISNFASAGVTELVVDLRYNGGGYGSTANALTNLIAPASQNGKVMYTTYFNQTMQSGNAKILMNQPYLDDNGKLIYDRRAVNGQYVTFADINFKPTEEAGNQELFEKRGNLNVNRVYFIVTGSTASASELLINNLKPVLGADGVKLIGRKTYGKPVGFFSLRIDKYDLYIPQFQTKNQLGDGDYFGGMSVDIGGVDDVTKDFGDINELYLALALNYTRQGSFTIAATPKIPSLSSLKAKSISFNKQVDRITEQLDKHEFKGMVETPSHFKRR